MAHSTTFPANGPLMAIFVLIILGMSLGWFSSILARTDAAGAILSQIGLGLVAALIFGFFFNPGSMLGGLTLLGLSAAAGGAILALVGYYFAVTRARRGDQTGAV
ncbi:MAG: hypothetical protein AAGH57_08040 [Pseudomonadota bacterium]